MERHLRLKADGRVFTIILGVVDRASRKPYCAYVSSPGDGYPQVIQSPEVLPGQGVGVGVGVGTRTAATSFWTARGALRVPEITVYFWVIKALSTALGEATSDFFVKKLHPIPAVGLGFVLFCVALALQFSRHRYVAWAYWLAVAGVGVFGTMAADVLHVGFHVPYIASSVLYAVVLGAVFFFWQRTEKTLSIHTIDTVRREAFYWAAVVATFAMGTALGDLTATTLHLGFAFSMVLFAGVILIPAVGYRWLGWNSIFTFWFAYVVTRPLGASFADLVGKPTNLSGIGWGSGRISLVLLGAIVCLVAFLSVTHRDVQNQHARGESAAK
jgi:uncharacterized membrane-anchored protein